MASTPHNLPPRRRRNGSKVVDLLRYEFEQALAVEPRWQRLAGSEVVNERFCDYFFRAAAVYHAQNRYKLHERPAERILARSWLAGGRKVWEPSSRNHPFDLLLDGTERLSIKTESSEQIKVDRIIVSKLMEVPQEQMPKDPAAAARFARNQVPARLEDCDRILTLRAHTSLDEKGCPCMLYELVEIPLYIFGRLARVRPAQISVRGKTLSLPLRVGRDKDPALEIKYDTSACKVGIRNLRADLCTVHASFLVPFGDEIAGAIQGRKAA